MVDFGTLEQEHINGLAATLATRYPNTEEGTPKSILLRHVSSLPLPSGDIDVDVTVWKDRFGMRIGVGRHDETDTENISPLPSMRMSEALGAFLDIWSSVSQLSITEASFVLFGALDQDDKQIRPRLGEELFLLKARPFGKTYDTALLFKWRDTDLLVGTVVAQVFPISTDGSHVHYTATYVLDDKDVQRDSDSKWKPSVKDFFSLATESAPEIVNDVLGGGPDAARERSS